MAVSEGGHSQKGKRFNRSRSKSQSNLPESPRGLNGSGYFQPKFISGQSAKENMNMGNKGMKEKEGKEGGNQLSAKLRILQLEDQVGKGERERENLRKEVRTYKEKCFQLQEKMKKSHQNSTSSSVNKSVKGSPLKEIKGNQNLKKLKRQAGENRDPQNLEELGFLLEENKGLKS